MPQVIKQNQGVPVCQAASPLNDRVTSQLGYSFVNAMVPKPTATLNPSGEHAFGRLLRPSVGPAILHPHTRWPGRLWWAAGGALRGFHAAAAGTSHKPRLSGRGLAAVSGLSTCRTDSITEMGFQCPVFCSSLFSLMCHMCS